MVARTRCLFVEQARDRARRKDRRELNPPPPRLLESDLYSVVPHLPQTRLLRVNTPVV